MYGFKKQFPIIFYFTNLESFQWKPVLCGENAADWVIRPRGLIKRLLVISAEDGCQIGIIEFLSKLFFTSKTFFRFFEMQKIDE